MALRRRFRGWAMVWALLQFALPSVATYADALLERAGVDVASHVESSTDTSCAPVHPADCAFCHAVQRVGTVSAGVCLPMVLGAVSAPAVTVDRVAVAAERGRLPLSRAPPVV